jgi:hypothetical protein
MGTTIGCWKWLMLSMGVSILGALYIEEKYGDSTLRVRIRVRARRVEKWYYEERWQRV